MDPVEPVGNNVYKVVPPVGYCVYWVVGDGSVGFCVVAVGLAQIVL